MNEHALGRKRIRLPSEVYCEPGRIFSVTIGTAPRHDVFTDMAFGLGCVDLLRDLTGRMDIRVFAFCLMPDHVHLLLGLGRVSTLAAFVGAWKSSCYALRRRHGNAATFWQRSFFDHALRELDDLQTTALYILHNPVRRGLATDYHDYPLCGSMVFEL